MVEPYHSSPIFDETSLPDSLQRAHSTKAGVWGLLRVLEGQVDLIFHEPHRVVRVTPDKPAEITPQALHHVEPDGPMRMQVEFYRERPL